MVKPGFLVALAAFAGGFAVTPAASQGAGIAVPEGFSVTVFADKLGVARHLAVAANGDVFVTVMKDRRGGGSGLVALRDTDGDGRADLTESFGSDESTGIGLYQGYLYASSNVAVYRYKLKDGELAPKGEREVVVADFPEQRQHAAKTLTFDDSGHLYVNVGAPSNACQVEMRSPGSPGLNPCPQLERGGGIWRFDAQRPGQTQMGDGHLYATGIRNSMAIDWNHEVGGLYVVQHGRDQLNALWPDLYSEEISAELPSEEFLALEDGGVYGWPYTYYDHLQDKRLATPEYGGDAKTAVEAGKYPKPIATFPGHWAPNDLIFHSGAGLPAKYKNGAFIAFHGSWNRAPRPQQGYRVAFVPFDGARPSGESEDFATGFAGVDPVKSPRDAKHRPGGLAEGPDGAIYVADSTGGRIYRIVFDGK